MENRLSANRDILDDENLDYKSKWLLIVLSDLSKRFTNEKTDCFFRSQENLILDCGMHQATIMRCRKQLIKGGWIKFWIGHRIDHLTNRKHRIMFYQILR